MIRSYQYPGCQSRQWRNPWSMLSAPAWPPCRLLFTTELPGSVYASRLLHFVSLCVFSCHCVFGIAIAAGRGGVTLPPFSSLSQTKEFKHSAAFGSSACVLLCKLLVVCFSQAWGFLIFFFNHLTLTPTPLPNDTFPFFIVPLTSLAPSTIRLFSNPLTFGGSCLSKKIVATSKKKPRLYRCLRLSTAAIVICLR